MYFKHCTLAQMESALAAANREYNGNLMFNRLESKGSRILATLRTRDSHTYGSRLSSNASPRTGKRRHIPAASWEAHRDFMLALYRLAPDTQIKTAMAEYNGVEDFRKKFPATRYRQVGSLMYPAAFGDLTINREET